MKEEFLERHPNLRVAFLEAGCGWLPYWLWRLDEAEYKHLAWEVKDNVKMKPSEYFRRQCFVSIEPDEPYLPEIIKYIGDDNLLFGSDFPHIDHDPEALEEVIDLEERLSKRTVQKFCGIILCVFMDWGNVCPLSLITCPFAVNQEMNFLAQNLSPFKRT